MCIPYKLYKSQVEQKSKFFLQVNRHDVMNKKKYIWIRKEINYLNSFLQLKKGLHVLELFTHDLL